MSSSIRDRPKWPALVFAALVVTVGGLVLIDRSPVSGPGSSPRFHEIRVSPDLRMVEAIPVAPAALSGHNLLLVTLDTTRADYIGCYGHEIAATPAIDQLARDGALFSQAIAPSTLTLPSHASMLTGLYPVHHGARTNAVSRLDGRNVTLAEVLSDGGYRTGAIVSAFVLDSQFGIDQGFRHFDDAMGDQSGDSIVRMLQRVGNETTDRAVAWMTAARDKPFFLWVHYFDAHSPYEAPSPFSERFEMPYDAEIAFADAQLGRLLETLDDLALTDRTLVVVAGDHGESLGQHDEVSHGLLIYDATVRVPLVMRWGGGAGAGVHLPRTVSLVDIMPTVLSLLGVPAPDDLDGVDLTGPPAGDDRAVFMEAMEGLAGYGWAPLFGVRTEAVKYIHGPGDELYDIVADPFEEHDLAASRPELASAMRQRIESLFGADPAQSAEIGPTRPLSAETLARLRSLGYLGGTGVVEAAGARPRPHPRDVLPVLNEVNVLVGQEPQIGLDEVIRRLQRVAREHPDFLPAHRLLGEALRRSGDFAGAEESFARCLEIRPGQIEPTMRLAQLKVRRGEVDEAAELFEQLLERVPDHFAALTGLARMLRLQGEYGKAVDLLVRALEARPRDGEVARQLVDTAVVANRAADTVEALRRQVEADPSVGTLRIALVRLLNNGRRFDEALAILRAGVESDPDRYDLVNMLALVLMNCPDPRLRSPDEAADLMQRVCEATDWQNPIYLHTLSNVYAVMLRFDEAIETAEKARRIALASDRPAEQALSAEIGRSLARYQSARSQR